MARYPDAFLEQIKNKVDIVDLISAYTSVQRKGRDYWACCPFHNEKTPSFQIRSDHQYYRCYGCGKHGNIFNFLMEYEHITFGEAVESLAKRAGLELPELVFDPEAKARKELLNKIYEINRLAGRFYFDNLSKPEGVPAREYLNKRGLSDKTIQKFGMGYSYDFYSLPKYLRSKGYDDKTMAQAGVVSINEKGEAIDFFGGRITIPIISGSNKVLGFSARVLNPKPNFAKYKNTSTTLAFNKRKNLFGINIFKKFNQGGSVRAMVLVEGHMDVISLYQAGVCNAVASMGTALTIEQCREIKRYADVVYVSFDGDSAGQHATLRGLELLKNEGLDVKVVCLTDNMDPDDYVRKYGKDGYLKLLDEALPLIDYKLMKVEEKYDLNNSDQKIKYTREAIEVLNGLDSVEKEVYAEKVSEKSGLKSEVILERSVEVKKEAVAVVTEPEQTKSDAVNSAFTTAERFVISSFIHGKNYVSADDLKEMRTIFSDDRYVKIFDFFMSAFIDGRKPKVADVFDLLPDDKDEVDAIIDALDSVNVSEQPQYFKNCLQKLKQNYKSKELTRLTTELLKETDNLKKEKIKLQIKELSKAQPK